MYTCTSICVYPVDYMMCTCHLGMLLFTKKTSLRHPLFCLTCVRDGLARLPLCVHGTAVYTRSMFSIELHVNELSYDTYPDVLTSLCMPAANLSLMYMPMLFDVMCKSLFVTHVTHIPKEAPGNVSSWCRCLCTSHSILLCVCALLYGFSLVTSTDTSSGCTTSLAKFKS